MLISEPANMSIFETFRSLMESFSQEKNLRIRRLDMFSVEEIWVFLDFHCIVLLHSYTYFKPTQSTQVHSVQHPAVVQQCFSFRKKERERKYRTKAVVVPRESRLTFRPRSPSHHEMFCTHHETIQREKERRRLKDDIDDFTHGEP